MRIALVSFEFAGTGSSGGIGTYFRGLREILQMRGHDVEVFTSGVLRPGHSFQPNSVHVVNSDRECFAEEIARIFSIRQDFMPFDVIESAEYCADARSIVSQHSEVPHVVKLHTPSFQIAQINSAYVSFPDKVRFIAGALRRGKAPRPYWNRDYLAVDAERDIVLDADVVQSPSKSLATIVAQNWNLKEETIRIVPNPYMPDQELLSIPAHRQSPVVTFLGKLEVRKGVIELAKAIPFILKQVPETKFRFVGRVLPHPATGEPLDHLVRRLAGRNALKNIDFTGGVAYESIRNFLEEAAVAVFPSYWENFPYVCLEAMAASCGVVGSSSGGMSEIIEHGRTGLLVESRNPQEIADAVCQLLLDPSSRIRMATAARAHIIDAYSPERIAPLQEASYRLAVKRADRRKVQTKPKSGRVGIHS